MVEAGAATRARTLTLGATPGSLAAAGGDAAAHATAILLLALGGAQFM
jgi:hypothetical protein